MTFTTLKPACSGVKAWLAAIRVLQIAADAAELPSAEDEGRMPTADRVRGFFGTNRLMLVEARLNSPRARFRVQRLDLPDVNPCFQALLLARRLLPQTAAFEVAAVDSDGPLLVIDAAGLDAAMPAWEYAVANLDQMPLAAFLPANYAARLPMESPAAAVRAAAWIAADDAVGAFDGSPASWDEGTRRLLGIRLRVVVMALDGTRGMVPSGTARLDSVQQSVRELQEWIRTDRPGDPDSAEAQPGLLRLRTQWRAWGPVPRLPSISEPPPPEFILQAPPGLRTDPPREYQSF